MFFSMDVRLWCSVYVYFNFVGNFPNWVFKFLSVHSCSSWFFCLFLHTQCTLAIRYSSLSSMDVNSTLFHCFSCGPTENSMCEHNRHSLPFFFSLSMHQSECRKCNRVSLHATYRLTFAGHFFFHFIHAIALWIRVLFFIRIFQPFFFLATLFFHSPPYFASFFCLIFSYLSALCIRTALCCVHNVYIFFIWIFFFILYVSPIWTWFCFFFILTLNFLRQDFFFFKYINVCQVRLFVYMNFKNFIQFYY